MTSPTGFKAGAEDVILAASARIGEELQRVPKASGRPKNITTRGKNKLGRNHAVGHDAGSLQSLSQQQDETEDDRREASQEYASAERERDLSTRIRALPDKRYGVIYGTHPGASRSTRDLIPGLNQVRPAGRSPSVPPEVFESRRAQCGVARGVGDGYMAEDASCSRSFLCNNYHCSRSVSVSGDAWPDELRPVRVQGL
jgi:hypothetical protein